MSKEHSVVAGWYIDTRDGYAHRLDPHRPGPPERDFVFKADCGAVIYPDHRGRRRKAPSFEQLRRLAPSTGACSDCMLAQAYPAHAAFKAAGAAPDAIGRFLDWLRADGYVLARQDDQGELLEWVMHQRAWIGAFIGVDPEVYDRETAGMLDAIREAQS